MICITLLLVACGAEKENPRKKDAEVQSIPLRSAEERAFDARLAAIHAKWMGTPWTFTGTSQTPRQGSIACGYFVTTTLEQAGMVLERVRLAQAASETMILAITPKSSIKRYSNASLEAFLQGVRRQGEGYYVVGLDNHTGFLKVEGDGRVTFIHSGPGRGVVSEAPEDAPELANSRYRVTGKIVETLNSERADSNHGN
jgi:hypothetical protein